jgi:hypothetical protein
MTKRTFAVGLAVAAVLAGGGALLASNMGFKLNYPLTQTTGGTSNGNNTISLPYNPQVGVSTAKTLMDDIGSASVFFIQRYIKSINTFETYTGRVGSPNVSWTLANEGYVVRMNTTVNYIVVGSHNPTMSIGLTQSSGGTSNGNNWLSFPYHHTANTAKQLMDDIGSASVFFIQRYIKSINTFETYTGRVGSPNVSWTNAPGEAYVVRMNTTVATYIPSHY